jgi:hypothetical protein
MVRSLQQGQRGGAFAAAAGCLVEALSAKIGISAGTLERWRARPES